MEAELREEKSCQEHLGYKGMNKRHGGYILTEHQYSVLYSKQEATHCSQSRREL